MSGPSMLTSVGASLNRLGVPHAVSIALEYAAYALSSVRGAAHARSVMTGHAPAEVDAPFARTCAPPRQECRSRFGPLPEGFVPVRQARSLELLGRWPRLDDGMPACLPVKLLLSMVRRCEQGDANAAAWIKLYYLAFSGETAAQRAFGEVCENGAHGTPADLQRAFFWYYRAALAGDAEARRNAERVARIAVISPAVIAEPALVYPGLWRITASMPGGATSSSLFELDENGAARGCLLGGRNAGNGTKHGAPAAFVGPCVMFLLHTQDAQYEGQWAYYNERRILTFDFAASVAGIPGVRSGTWQIEMAGCRRGALFGHDRRSVSYILEHEDARPSREAQAPLGTAAARRP